MKVDLTVNGEELKLVNDAGTTHINCDLVEGAEKIKILASYDGGPLVEIRVNDSESRAAKSYADAFGKANKLNDIRGTVTWNGFTAHFDQDGPWVDFNGTLLPKLYEFELILPADEVPRARLRLFGIEGDKDE